MIKPNGLNPFKRFCITIGELPSSYMESMTYYEMLEWFCRYLEKTVIPAVNNNAEAITELQNLFIELKSYVDNYFTNLDVQEEINNKLDDMATSGELTEIITAYLEVKSVLAFDTVEDMTEATNLIDGSFVKTYGFYEINDGGGAYYKIITQTTEEVDNIHIFAIENTSLIAILNEHDTINVKKLGAYGDNSHNDSNAIDYALNNFKNVYFPSGIYIYNNYNENCYANNIYGDSSEIKRTATTGLAYMFKFNHNVTISNLKFNSNNVGRGCINIYNTEFCKVNNCEFTGYSNTYGYYQTDSLLLIGGVDFALVDNCNFYESGYNLTNITENLNRAITAQNCDKCVISNSNFYKLMQAICSLNNETIIKGCSFDYIKDNNVYNLSYEEQKGDLIITNCYISNRHDEGIVIRGNKTIISNNIIENIPTAVNLAGNCEDITITNNTFYNIGTDEQSGNIISTRDNAYTVNNLIIDNNNIDLPVDTPSTTGQYAYIPLSTNLSITNNNVQYKGRNYGRGMYIIGTTNLKLINNSFIDLNNSTDSNAIQLNSLPTNSIISNNITGLLRIGAVSTIKNLEYVTTNIGPYLVSTYNKKIFSGGSIPTVGSWNKGDIIINYNPSASGSFGWICVEAGSPGTWKSISTIES